MHFQQCLVNYKYNRILTHKTKLKENYYKLRTAEKWSKSVTVFCRCLHEKEANFKRYQMVEQKWQKKRNYKNLLGFLRGTELFALSLATRFLKSILLDVLGISEFKTKDVAEEAFSTAACWIPGKKAKHRTSCLVKQQTKLSKPVRKKKKKNFCSNRDSKFRN